MRLITELGTVRLTLRALSEGLLSEVDAARFARRAAGKGLVIDEKIMILVDPETPVSVDDKIIPKPLGMVAVEDYPAGGAVILHQFYADNPSAAIVLILGALAHWKTVVPDSQVTPAARKMIQTFWKKYRNDPSRVTPNFVKKDSKQAQDIHLRSGGADEDRWDQDYLNAAYHDGGGFPLQQFEKVGMGSIDGYSKRFEQSFEDVVDGLEAAIGSGWESAYSDSTKTGRASAEKAGSKRG
jgi:hypothetical protein